LFSCGSLIVIDLSLLLLKVLSLRILLLISVIEINMGLNYGAQVLNRFLGPNRIDLFLTSLRVLGNVELDYATLLIEEVKVLHLMTINILDYRVVKRDISFFESDLFEGSLDILFVLSINSYLAFFAVTLLNEYLNSELFRYLLNLRAL
jgi:hypothetical protein